MEGLSDFVYNHEEDFIYNIWGENTAKGLALHLSWIKFCGGVAGYSNPNAVFKFIELLEGQDRVKLYDHIIEHHS